MPKIMPEGYVSDRRAFQARFSVETRDLVEALATDLHLPKARVVEMACRLLDHTYRSGGVVIPPKKTSDNTPAA